MTFDVNQMLRNSGIGWAEATAAVPFMFFTPNNSDPDMTPVMTIIKAIQKTMGLPVDGVMGPQTSTRLRAAVPQDIILGTTYWYELLGYAQKAPRARVVPPSGSGEGGEAMSGFDVGSLMNPWVIGGGVALLYLLTKKKRRR